ncbi:MAG TPA: restriction endonuclease subunit S [Turneriella sp.]|nr:restriction endonuclease subunit S [Turneriella sp.]
MAKQKNKSPKTFPSSGGVAEGRGGHVPRLRFPEFRSQDSWPALTMNEISTRITEKVGSEKLTPVSITAGKGFVTQTEKFGRDISGDQYKNYVLLREGEFAYNKGNSKKYAQGCIYKLKEFKKVAAPYAYISFRLNDGYEPDFFQFYFEMNAHGKQLQKYITSGARSDGLLNIDPIDFFRISLPIPSLPEQQRIADCLTSLDEVISAESQKLDALKVHKKGLMQQLFPSEGGTSTSSVATVPRLRFPEFRDSGGWEEKTLGKIAEIKRGAGSQYLEYVEDSQLGIRLLRINDFLNNDAVYVRNTEDMKRFRVKAGDLLIAGTGATAGITYMVPKEYDNLAYSYNAPRIRLTEGNNYFIAQYLKSDHIFEQQTRLFVGNAQPFLDTNAIANFKICLPSLAEQKRIANCLSSLDDLIAAQAEKIDALKEQKKGLMQGLFPVAGE